MNKKNFKQSKTNDKFRGIFPFEFDEGEKDEPAIPEKIHLVPIGQWEHDLYGPIIITAGDIREFIQNFNAGIRRGVFITAGHEGYDEKPAVGWVTELEPRDTGLWGNISWNPEGKKLLSERAFKFFSPEMCRDYEDPQSHQYYRNVLTGGALTKSPYFKELEAIVFSDKNISKDNLNKKHSMKTLEEILALDADKLTAEDKEVLKANESKLTAEQKKKYFAEEETAEAKATREAAEKKATEDANVAAGLNPDGSAKETGDGGHQEHSDKKGMVMIHASELAILRTKADEGAHAFAALNKAEVETFVNTLVFSETNKAGKYLPKSKDNLRAFIEKLSKDQRLAFSALTKDVIIEEKFSEKGATQGAAAGTALAEINAKIAEKIKADDKLSESAALKQVVTENPELAKRYDSELVG